MAVQLSRLAEFKAAEKALAQQVAAFEEMRSSPELKREIEFDAALTTFLDKNKMTRAGLLEFLQIELAASLPPREKRTYKPRDPSSPKPERKPQSFDPVDFVNPHTGERITVRLRTHSTYKKWVVQYGKDAVESWKVPTA